MRKARPKLTPSLIVKMVTFLIRPRIFASFYLSLMNKQTVLRLGFYI